MRPILKSKNFSGARLANDLIGIGSDQPIEWCLTDEDGNLVLDATITGAFKDSSGVLLDTFTLDLVNSTTAEYRGYIANGVTSGLNQYDEYFVELTAVAGELQEFRRISIIADYRGDE
jgi:hypothetical protein